MLRLAAVLVVFAGVGVDQQHPGSLQRGPGQQRVHGTSPDERGLVDDPQLLANRSGGSSPALPAVLALGHLALRISNTPRRSALLPSTVILQP